MLALLLFLSSLILWGQVEYRAFEERQSERQIEIPGIAEFGDIHLGDTATLNLDVVNRMNRSISIVGSDERCGHNFCVWVESPLPMRIDAGTRENLEIQVSAKGSGPLVGAITVYVDDGRIQRRTIRLSGTID
jgi:hypothetical protein